MRLSLARIWSLLKPKLQQRILGNANLQFTVLPLWGWLKDVFLFLDHEVNYNNADPRFKLRRVLLFAVHPQRLFYEPRNSATTARQDRITSAAAQMVGGEINCVEGYYANKIWQKRISKTLILAIERAAINGRHREEIDKDLQNLSPIIRSENPEGIWSEYFSTLPHSNEELRKSIPDALKACETTEGDEDWRDPSDFPEAVLNWFKGQREILFHDKLRAIREEMAAALSHAVSPALGDIGLSLKQVICRIIRNQHQMLSCQKKSKNHLLDKRQDLWHSGFSEHLVICCELCGSSRNEESSRWAVKRPGHYIAHHLVCNSRKCEDKKRWFIPQDQNIPWVKSDFSKLDVPARPISREWESCLRPRSGDTLGTPSTVQSWCIQCQASTLLSGNRQRCADSEPRWTLGYTRPLYIEPTPECRRCLEQRRSSGRFVPVEPTIASITVFRLTKFAKTFGKYDDHIQARLLITGLRRHETLGHIHVARVDDRSCGCCFESRQKDMYSYYRAFARCNVSDRSLFISATSDLLHFSATRSILDPVSADSTYTLEPLGLYCARRYCNYKDINRLSALPLCSGCIV